MSFQFQLAIGGCALGSAKTPTGITPAKRHTTSFASGKLLHKPEEIQTLIATHLDGNVPASKFHPMPGGQLIALLGLAGSGKTTLMNDHLWTPDAKQYSIVFAEPEGDLLATPSLLKEMGLVIEALIKSNKYKYTPFRVEEGVDEIVPFEHDALRKVQPAPPVSDIGVIMVDSFRKFFYEPGQSTGAGGVNNELFITLTEWAVFARRTGLTIIVSLNPLLDDEEKLMPLAMRVAGSVDTTIVLEGKPSDTGFMAIKASSRFWPSRAWFTGNITMKNRGRFDTNLSQKKEVFSFSNTAINNLVAPLIKGQ